MKRSYLTNLLLLFLVLGLLWQLEQVNTPQVNTIGNILKSDMVTEITVARGSQSPITLIRDGQNWQLQTPFSAPASISRVTMLLSLLDTVASEQFAVTDDMDLQQFGLADPMLSLTFNNQTFHFGDEAQLTQQRYLLSNQTIYLFDDTISPLLQASASGFIENRLFANMAKLQSISVPFQQAQTLQADSIRFEQQSGQWQTNTSGLTTDQLTAIAQSWQQAYAMQVSPSEVMPDAGFQPLSFTFKDGQSVNAFARLSPEGLSILLPERQLQYQFPTNIAVNLFPTKN
ncbi:DUF4340 domain-containing protein [Methylophaga sp. OBS3]|uniref:DUF4340 domain-containing protein n=1 Tax=Methylophaga sp. OBS3 TaxID=2991934 RepID=UPI00224EE4B9|nr:DUF4340 domain-containing protein [Methylophaga sp. OBS3]MCX4188763.1 DUF4340 domain-containing protein [Methylophaga sp. OBS3]